MKKLLLLAIIAMGLSVPCVLANEHHNDHHGQMEQPHDKDHHGSKDDHPSKDEHGEQHGEEHGEHHSKH